MRGKLWLTPQAREAHGLASDTLRGNEGPSSLRGSLVAMEETDAETEETDTENEETDAENK